MQSFVKKHLMLEVVLEINFYGCKQQLNHNNNSETRVQWKQNKISCQNVGLKNI